MKLQPFFHKHSSHHFDSTIYSIGQVGRWGSTSIYYILVAPHLPTWPEPSFLQSIGFPMAATFLQFMYKHIKLSGAPCLQRGGTIPDGSSNQMGRRGFQHHPRLHSYWSTSTPQGGGGRPLRDNLGDLGRAGLQLLCARRRHHNDGGWNGYLQHRQECKQVQGDYRLPDWRYSGFFLQVTFPGVQEDSRSVYYQPCGKVENRILSFRNWEKVKKKIWKLILNIRMLLLSKEHLQVGNQEYQVRKNNIYMYVWWIGWYP